MVSGDGRQCREEGVAVAVAEAGAGEGQEQNEDGLAATRGGWGVAGSMGRGELFFWFLKVAV